MKYSRFPLLLAALLATACNSSEGPDKPARSKWIKQIVEYRPAPGQFINTYLGSPDAAQGIVGGKSGCLSLGGFGGSVTFAFDHDVQNVAGPDFVIFGNAFDGSSEPGIVLVSPDGTTWYRLRGSEDGNAATVPDYRITYARPSQTSAAEAVRWTDNQSPAGGEISTVGVHGQCYWPLWLAGNPATLEFSGIRLPDNAVFTGQKYDLQTFAGGYADNWSVDYNQTVGGDADTRGGNKFDLDNAVDAAGTPVVLTSVRQIKVYTALNQWVGAGVGETSTEVCGALSLSAGL